MEFAVHWKLRKPTSSPQIGCDNPGSIWTGCWWTEQRSGKRARISPFLVFSFPQNLRPDASVFWHREANSSVLLSKFWLSCPICNLNEIPQPPWSITARPGATVKANLFWPPGIRAPYGSLCTVSNKNSGIQYNTIKLAGPSIYFLFFFSSLILRSLLPYHHCPHRITVTATLSLTTPQGFS